MLSKKIPDSSPSSCAIYCAGLSLDFPIFEQGDTWKVILGIKSPQKIFHALQDISFNVPKGKFLGILGRNGAGKSTLLRTIAGVYHQDNGTNEVKGSIATLFELGGFSNNYISGREYAHRFFQLKGMKKSEIVYLVEEVKQFSELKDSFEDKIYTYSSGMAARLYFSTATAIPHDVYLVDEILSVGDEHFQAKCWSKLRERFSEGASGILVTHDWASILKICEQACILEHGRIVATGSADKLVQRYLDIPKPLKEKIFFCENNPTSYQVASGQDAKIKVDIFATECQKVELAYSIEHLVIGQGWDILLMSAWETFQVSLGHNLIQLCIPKLPIAPGKYYFNLFLRKHSNTEEIVNYDALTWTCGNGIELIVHGETSTSLTLLPFKWREVET